MKIRIGFVSNSSSSSYILIIKKDEYDELYNSLSKLEKHILDNLQLKDKKFGDIDIKVHTEWFDCGSCWIDYIDEICFDEYNKENIPDEYKQYFNNNKVDIDILDHVISKLKKIKGSTEFDVDM